jgi:hypothetical protein
MFLRRAATSGPEVPGDAFVAASLKAVVMHEVGHTLGLRHNFGSTVYPLAKISDPKFSTEVGSPAQSWITTR